MNFTNHHTGLRMLPMGQEPLTIIQYNVADQYMYAVCYCCRIEWLLQATLWWCVWWVRVHCKWTSRYSYCLLQGTWQCCVCCCSGLTVCRLLTREELLHSPSQIFSSDRRRAWQPSFRTRERTDRWTTDWQSTVGVRCWQGTNGSVLHGCEKVWAPPTITHSTILSELLCCACEDMHEKKHMRSSLDWLALWLRQIRNDSSLHASFHHVFLIMTCFFQIQGLLQPSSMPRIWTSGMRWKRCFEPVIAQRRIWTTPESPISLPAVSCWNSIDGWPRMCYLPMKVDACQCWCWCWWGNIITAFLWHASVEYLFSTFIILAPVTSTTASGSFLPTEDMSCWFCSTLSNGQAHCLIHNWELRREIRSATSWLMTRRNLLSLWRSNPWIVGWLTVPLVRVRVSV